MIRKMQTVLLTAMMLAAGLLIATPTASAHVCTDESSTGCAADDCDDGGLLHIHVTTSPVDSCSSVCGDACGGTDAARAETESASSSTLLGSIGSFFSGLAGFVS